MMVIGVHHAGVHVTSLERSIAFYQAVFRLRLAERLSLGAEQLAFLQAGGSRIELIADGAGARDTGVVDHLALEVDDLDGWLLRLRERGIRLLDEAPVDVPPLGARILFCLGPDGERIELFERRAPVQAVP
jgi:catechol 2,3-dioxygenase-like lactoylglutathione lyase family enzyme